MVLKLITILLMEKILILSEFIYYGNGLQLMPVLLELPIPVVKRTNLKREMNPLIIMMEIPV